MDSDSGPSIIKEEKIENILICGIYFIPFISVLLSEINNDC